MADVFKVAFEFSVQTTLGQLRRLLGDRFTRTTFTPTLGVVFDATDVIPDAYGQETLWATGQGGIDTFEYLFFLSDVDVHLEIVNTTTSPDERFLVLVKAGIPFVLPGGKVGAYVSDTSRIDGNILVSGTDYNNVTQIRVQNAGADGTGDATIRLILVA